MDRVNVIILCGGKGSRVKSFLGETPKVLTPRGGTPHLVHILSQITSSYPCSKVFLATGIGGQSIQTVVSDEKMNVTVSYESVPLGTGGAILKCMENYNLKNALVMNGDTIYTSLPSISVINALQKNTIFLSYKENRDRFGAVDFDSNRNAEFLPKGTKTPGLVNSGVYYVTDNLLKKHELDAYLSLETQIIDTNEFDFHVSDLTFQDFGVPEDLVQFTDIKND